MKVLTKDEMALYNDNNACSELPHQQEKRCFHEPEPPAPLGPKQKTPFRLCMPEVALYHMCKHMKLAYGTAEGIAALLRTCKSWRLIVQSAVEHLEMKSVSQVSLTLHC